MKASARIQVTLDVPVKSSWGDGTDIAQIRKQAIEDGLNRLQDLLNERASGFIRVVGEPKVTIVLVEDV